MIFVGFMDGSKSIRYYDAKSRLIRVSRNITFSENEEPKEIEDFTNFPGLQAEGENSQVPSSQTELENTPKISTISTIPKEPQHTQNDPRESHQLHTRRATIDYRKLDNPQSRLPSLQNIPSPTPTRPPDISRPTESSKAKSKIQEQANFALGQLFGQILNDQLEYSFNSVNQDDPKTVEEALNGPDAMKWKEAMEIEMETIRKMGTWRLEELPKERQPIGNKWVFLRKRDEYGNIVCFKARLIAQGFSQKPGTDYSNDVTFAPVMQFEMLQTLLALAAVNNWKIHQFDIKGAYLHGTLHETIFMQQPEAFEDGSGQVCRLI